MSRSLRNRKNAQMCLSRVLTDVTLSPRSCSCSTNASRVVIDNLLKMALPRTYIESEKGQNSMKATPKCTRLVIHSPLVLHVDLQVRSAGQFQFGDFLKDKIKLGFC